MNYNERMCVLMKKDIIYPKNQILKDSDYYFKIILFILFVLLYICAIIVIFYSKFKTVYEPPLLLPFMNTIFIGLISIVVSIISANAYLSKGMKTFFFMISGMILFGCGASVSGWLINILQMQKPNVTI